MLLLVKGKKGVEKRGQLDLKNTQKYCPFMNWVSIPYYGYDIEGVEVPGTRQHM